MRQHSERHASALAELLKVTGLRQDDYSTLTESERVDILTHLLSDPRVLPRHELILSEETRHVLDTFDAIRQAREEFGEKAVTCYIISMARTVSDLLEVQFFCKEAGITRLPIVPLFETIDDLRSCPGIMENIFTQANSRGHRSRLGLRHVRRRRFGRRRERDRLEGRPAARRRKEPQQPVARPHVDVSSRARGEPEEVIVGSELRHRHHHLSWPRRRHRARRGTHL